MKKVHQQYGNPFIPSKPKGFETHCKPILEQQVSLESVRPCYTKLENYFKKIKPENSYHASEEEL